MYLITWVFIGKTEAFGLGRSSLSSSVHELAA